MAMRMTGMVSGMDTESIVQDLVAARRKKVDDVTKKQTKHQWKQEAWKGLNTKLKNLQNKYLSNMRFTTAYNKKTTNVSNSNAVSVITGDNAVNGVQSLEIDKLAKTGYLTGDKLASDKEITAMSKITDLTGGNISGETSLELEIGGKKSNITINEDTTISDVLTQLQKKGLNASFDAKQQRLFVSSKESGDSNNFNIKAVADDANSAKALKALGLDTASGATKVDGQDAEIKLNGATFTSSNNVFEINGLTITAKETTAAGQSISLSTEMDTSGIYDMIKNFIKEYNSVINEIDKLYNADAAKGLEPLTNDEKDAMSETEIEEWEKKIKESVLRRDSDLSSVGSTLKNVMNSTIKIGGKEYGLYDFGINALGYFNAAENERNAFHIDGDEDDENTSGNTDKLKAMIASDPNTVITYFTKLSQDLYGKMSDMSKSVEGRRTFGSFYDDKKMQSDYDDYTTKIKDMEDKLNAYEDKWYKKFSKMETAMAKMQSNASAVSGLFGGN